MTVWTSVLWMIFILLANKWSKMVGKCLFISYKFWWSVSDLSKIASGLKLHFVSYLFNKLRFRPIKHLKMTVWTSVLWNYIHVVGEKMTRNDSKTAICHLQILGNSLYVLCWEQYYSIYNFGRNNDVPGRQLVSLKISYKKKATMQHDYYNNSH